MRFNVLLQAKFWNTSPHIKIRLNKKTVENVNNFVNAKETGISFDVDLEEGEHQLVIERLNKSTNDTIVKDSKILKDSTVDIIDVEIDNISIEPLLDHANCYPRYPEPWLSQQIQSGKRPPVSFNYCRTLHHNCEWKLDFATPVHVWFFQNINMQI
jgi:hypothetical protein